MTEEEKAKQDVITEIIAKKDKGESLSEDELLIYNTCKKVVKEESSWLKRNASLIGVCVILFIAKMCSDLSK